MGLDPLHDAHGRRISDLRVSVTDRCNFRCQYCMPADGLPWMERAEILRFEEVERLVRLLVAIGVEDVRLTGGEHLVRREFPKLVGMAGIRGRTLIVNFPGSPRSIGEAGEAIAAGLPHALELLAGRSPH